MTASKPLKLESPHRHPKPALDLHAVPASGLITQADRTWIIQKIAELSTAGKFKGQMVLMFVDDTEMDRLHREHLNIKGTTDVLTFDMRDDDEADIDVEAVVCVDEAARQARLHGHLPRAELLLYALHALLHVSGFDDKTPAKSKKMHAEEDRLLSLIGLGPVYQPDPKKPAAKPSASKPAKKLSPAKTPRKPAQKPRARAKP